MNAPFVRTTPTGRGTAVRAGTVSLAELLRRYDLAKETNPDFVSMSRKALIAKYHVEGGQQP